jgi:hypothetical protein
MELAGLACAQTLAKAFPKEEYRKVLVITGPGNQVKWLSDLRGRDSSSRGPEEADYLNVFWWNVWSYTVG